jgi:Icc-related predicted phosphoesterase
MKIKLLSDIHLSWGGMKVTNEAEADVLILAGDILEVDEITKESPQGKYFLKFLKECGKKYPKVFYVLGNHEHYYSDVAKTAKDLRKVLPKNVVVLDNETETYEGVNFVGTTLWTNINNENPDDIRLVEYNMNDYRAIRNGDYGMLTVEKVLDMHDVSVKFLKQTLPTLTGPTVVITHHAPSLRSLSPDYNHELKAAYASNLDELIKEYQPELWCHGHIHSTNDYTLGKTRVVSNPRGYANYGENHTFDDELILEVPVGKVAQTVHTVT